MQMKYRLATPGPAMVPPDTLLELAREVRHHRTPENKALIADAIAKLKAVFCTAGDVVILAGSGTAAMEAAVANVVKPGDKAVVLIAGKWGERWAELVKTFGGKVVAIEHEPGVAITPEELKETLDAHSDAVAVLTQLSETTSGVGHDVEGMGRVVAGTDALFVVDGISGVGAMECRMDDWGIDLLCVGSQKALMMPPGLAFVGVSAKAMGRLEDFPEPPSYYVHLRKFVKKARDADTPYTPAHTLIAALVKSLDRILDEGLETCWRRHAVMTDATLAAVRALGLEPLADRPAGGVTAIKAPEGIDGEAWAKQLENKYGVKIAGGQNELKGKIIRVAHMGYMDPLDMVGIVAALEYSLLDLGHEIDLGAGVLAAHRVFADALCDAAVPT